MSMLWTDLNAPAGCAEGSTPPRVAIVYEDFATGARAKSALESLLGHQECEADLLFEMWRFDLLRDPEIRSQVCEQMASVDLIVLSAHGKSDLPAEVRLWLNQWLKERRGWSAALVVSLDETAKDGLCVRQMLASLQSAANAAGVDVFPHFGSGRASREGALTVENLNPGFVAGAELFDEMPGRTEGYRDWGINE